VVIKNTDIAKYVYSTRETLRKKRQKKGSLKIRDMKRERRENRREKNKGANFADYDTILAL